MQSVGSGRRIKLFSGGSFGRGTFYDAAWFKANAVSLYLGALQVPGGRGARALHVVGGTRIEVVVDSPDEPPADGLWRLGRRGGRG